MKIRYSFLLDLRAARRITILRLRTEPIVIDQLKTKRSPCQTYQGDRRGFDVTVDHITDYIFMRCNILIRK